MHEAKCQDEESVKGRPDHDVVVVDWQTSCQSHFLRPKITENDIQIQHRKVSLFVSRNLTCYLIIIDRSVVYFNWLKLYHKQTWTCLCMSAQHKRYNISPWWRELQYIIISRATIGGGRAGAVARTRAGSNQETSHCLAGGLYKNTTVCSSLTIIRSHELRRMLGRA